MQNRRNFESTFENLREKLNNTQTPVTEDSIRQLVRREMVILDQSSTTSQQQKKVQFSQEAPNPRPVSAPRRFFPPSQMSASERHQDNEEEEGGETNEIDNKNAGNKTIQNNNFQKTNPSKSKAQSDSSARKKGESHGLWEEVLLFYNKGDLNGAYSLLLDEEDDVYLLKLMTLTGPCVGKLQKLIGRRLMSRLCLIINSRFLDKMYIGVFHHCLQERVVHQLQPIQRKKLANEVYKLSSSPHPDVGESAADLYLRLSRTFQE